MDVLGAGGAIAWTVVHLRHELAELGVGVVPLAEAHVRDEVVTAPSSEVVAGELLLVLVELAPELELAEEVRALFAEEGVGGVGFRGAVDGAVTRVLGGEGGGDDEGFGEAVLGIGGDEHAADAGVDGETRELAADVREITP